MRHKSGPYSKAAIILVQLSGGDGIIITYNKVINTLGILDSIPFIFGFVIQLYFMVRKIGFQ